MIWRVKEKTGNLSKITGTQVHFLTVIFNRWIRHDLRIDFMQADCKNFELSFHNINISYRSLLGNFPEISEIFQEISRKFLRISPTPPYPPPTLGTHPYISTPYPYLFITKIKPKTSNRFFLHYSFLVQFPVFSFTI